MANDEGDEVRGSPPRGFEQRLSEVAATVDRDSGAPLTAQEIQSTVDDARLLSRVTQRLLARANFGRSLSTVNALCRAFVLTTLFEEDVYDGGLVQFLDRFHADPREAVLQLEDGYRALGATGMANVVSDVLTEFDNGSLRMTADLLECRVENTELLRLALVRNHPADFVG